MSISWITNNRLVSDTVVTPFVEYTIEGSSILIWHIDHLPRSNIDKQVIVYVNVYLKGTDFSYNKSYLFYYTKYNTVYKDGRKILKRADL
jgi:hypothetical protein